MRWLPPFDTPLGHILASSLISFGLIVALILLTNWKLIF
jgi:hypothetical protein